PPLDTFHGSKRNSEGVALIDDEKISYLEPHASNPPDASTPKTATPDAWRAKPSKSCANDPSQQSGDLACPDGYYCDRGTSAGSADGHCYRQETAVLRAFRDAETPVWCSDDTFDDLDRARIACVASAQGVQGKTPE